MRVLELPTALRDYGLNVIEVAGWQTRGNEFPERPRGALRHWTAGPKTGATPSLNVVTFGRADLPGPLCNTYQARRAGANGLDDVYVVASGKSNHAGVGNWLDFNSNYGCLGLEIEWAGPTEFFPDYRRYTSELIMRAMLDCAGGRPQSAAEHREFAKPLGRKIDTNLDGNVLRSRMAEISKNPGYGNEDEDMTIFCQDAFTGWWAVNGVWRNQVTEETVNKHVYLAGLGGVPPEKVKFPSGDFSNLMINTTQDATRLGKLYAFYADGTTGIINPTYHSAAEHALNDHADIDSLLDGQKEIKAQDAANLRAILNAIDAIEIPDDDGGAVDIVAFRKAMREEVEAALNKTSLTTG